MRPADCNVNSVRSNKWFAECGTVDDMSSCVSPAHSEAAADTEKDTKSFLPPASHRGDVARAILYMDLRYDGDEPDTVNLVVSDCPENVPVGSAGMGYLSQLLQWHMDDPPDEGERIRNDEICASEYIIMMCGVLYMFFIHILMMCCFLLLHINFNCRNI